ncbi:hypothetical protein [Bacillus cereus]|nr:hypothetical protein [Bacillus cereus]
MEKDVNFFVGLLWGGLFSLILWISFAGWMKIVTTNFHYCKDWLVSFWQL